MDFHIFLSIGLQVLHILKATAMNERSNLPASNLIDGNPRKIYHTTGSWAKQPWVQLELQPGFTVHRVIIKNRISCCGNRLRDLEVRVGNVEVTKQNQQGLSSNSLCNTWNGPGQNGEIVDIECSQAITGKYITIQIKTKRGVRAMNIGEVEALGTLARK